MAGETDLKTLLRTIRPRLHPGMFVFCSVPEARYGDYAELNPVGAFVEGEGLTLVVAREQAEATGFSCSGRYRMITLQVHSSLEAVGLTAAVAGRLTEHGISTNVVAAYYHDHVLVPAERAEEAVAVLRALAAEAAENRPPAGLGKAS